ncbi:MAG: glycerol-3-phosphate dehydrogenase/oxidase [Chloroflexota bacterium]
MRRDLSALAQDVQDVLVIGGGIYGACSAWEAALRGLSVALVDKGDFGAATSANSLKVIHGGLRYLQHGDLARMRDSVRERTTLMRIAPHLIHPLPVLIPTYGHGLMGREIMSLALLANDAISLDRNCLPDSQKHIPSGRILSKEECVEILPGIDQERLTGAALFYDAQAYNTERLTLAFLHSAAFWGAHLANYVKVVRILTDHGRVIGAVVEDELTGNRFDVRARTVLNTSGPWANQIVGSLNGRSHGRTVTFAKAFNLVTRSLLSTYAVGISVREKHRHAGALVNRGNRLLFIVPWRNHSLIGTEYHFQGDNPDEIGVTEQEIRQFLDEVNDAFPSARLTLEDVSFVHAGLVPTVAGRQGSVCGRLAKRPLIWEHRAEGASGLWSVVGVKYTTARSVAEKVIDQVIGMLGRKCPPSLSSVTPLYGGDISSFAAFLKAESERRPSALSSETVSRLIYNYGSVYRHVLRYLDVSRDAGRLPADEQAVLRAEVIYSVREEMAVKLSDVVLRRTELGSAGHPGHQALRLYAEVMATELGWGRARAERELQQVQEFYRWAHADEADGETRLAASPVQPISVEAS